MLLTLTYKGENATDLGFLLFKNPSRPQAFELSYGKAYVFYTETETDVCTAALLLDIDPIDLARGKAGSKDGGLFDYVSDRPYVSSSFMSSAISRVFGTAMSGRCDQRPELAAQPLDLTATLTNLPCKSDTAMLARVFEPLGYTVSFKTAVLDEQYPQWGDARYVDLTISGKARLQDLLRHLFVLIPVFDRAKHYWIGPDEIDKLLRHGEGWLERHPEQRFIAERYMGGKRGLARRAVEAMALDRMDDGQEGAAPSDEVEEPAQRPPSLNTRRLTAVVEAVRASGASSVIDMGCGEGNLLSLLLKERGISRIAGMDVSYLALERAAQKLKIDRMGDAKRERITLFQSSLTYKDDRFSGFDAACVVEVIEHLDENRLTAFEQVLFGEAKPKTVVLTTPNVEYNENYAALSADALRHGDHRFEWSRAQFEGWAGGVARRYGYTVKLSQIGDADERLGAPTQMGVFTVCV